MDEVLEEEWERGVTVIYVITYQMKHEGCVNQRVNTQLDKWIYPVNFYFWCVFHLNMKSVEYGI